MKKKKKQPVDTVQNFAFCNGTIWQSPLTSWPLILTNTRAPLAEAVMEENEAKGHSEGVQEKNLKPQLEVSFVIRTLQPWVPKFLA